MSEVPICPICQEQPCKAYGKRVYKTCLDPECVRIQRRLAVMGNNQKNVARRVKDPSKLNKCLVCDGPVKKPLHICPPCRLQQHLENLGCELWGATI